MTIQSQVVDFAQAIAKDFKMFKAKAKECVIIVLYQLRNGGPLGLIEACSNSATPITGLYSTLFLFFCGKLNWLLSAFDRTLN